MKLGGVLLWGEDDLKEFLSHKADVDASLSKLPEGWVKEVAGMIQPVDMREKSEFYAHVAASSAKCEDFEVARNCLAVNVLSMPAHKSDLADSVISSIEDRIEDPNWEDYPRLLSVECYSATRLFMDDRKGYAAARYVNRDDIARLVKDHLNEKQYSFCPTPYVSERGMVTHNGSAEFASRQDRLISVAYRNAWVSDHEVKVKAAHKAVKEAAKEAKRVMLRAHFINALDYS